MTTDEVDAIVEEVVARVSSLLPAKVRETVACTALTAVNPEDTFTFDLRVSFVIDDIVGRCAACGRGPKSKPR